VGPRSEADELYPEVLTDVAVRWTRLEVLRRWLGRRDAAERYLHRSFQRRSQEWQPDESLFLDVEVFRSYAPPPPPRSNAAIRLAPHLRTTARPEFAVLAEAAIAWWHAYETRRRRRLIGGLVLALVLTAFAMRLQQPAQLVLVGLLGRRRRPGPR